MPVKESKGKKRVKGVMTGKRKGVGVEGRKELRDLVKEVVWD